MLSPGVLAASVSLLIGLGFFALLQIKVMQRFQSNEAALRLLQMEVTALQSQVAQLNETVL